MGKLKLFIKKCHLVRGYIVNDVILDTPFDEIQLCQRRLNFVRCPRNRICKLLCPTERVKQLLTVPIETRFVGTMDGKQLSIPRLIGNIILLCVVRDEPLQISKRDATRFVQNSLQFCSIPFVTVKVVDRC